MILGIIDGARMDGFQLFASLVQSLAWPGAFVIAVLLFRRRLAALLPMLKLKHKDFEASFRLDHAEEEAKKLPAPAPGSEETKPTPEEKTRFEQLADISPEAAIVELRKELEEAVKVLWQMSGSGITSPQSMLLTIRKLRNKGVIDARTSALLDDLRAIGNEAAHPTNSKFTKEEAMRYRALADQVLNRIATAQLNQLMK